MQMLQNIYAPSFIYTQQAEIASNSYILAIFQWSARGKIHASQTVLSNQ